MQPSIELGDRVHQYFPFYSLMLGQAFPSEFFISTQYLNIRLSLTLRLYSSREGKQKNSKNVIDFCLSLYTCRNFTSPLSDRFVIGPQTLNLQHVNGCPSKACDQSPTAVKIKGGCEAYFNILNRASRSRVTFSPDITF